VRRDVVVLAALVVAFATLLTVHVTLALGLMRRTPRWHGALALVVPPLAPWWGWREGMRVRAAIWLLAAPAYAVSLWLASA
jgi:hypothetical protein